MMDWTSQIPPQGDAIPAHVLAPHTFQSKGSYAKKTGTIPDNTNKSVSPNGSPLAAVGSLTIWPQNGYYDGTSSKVVINDSNIDPANVKVGINFLGTDGTYTSDGDVVAADIATGKIAYANGQRIVGAAVAPVAFEPAHFTVQTNASAFNQNGGNYVLLFNSSVPDAKDNLLGLSITFMTAGDATWEYETGKNFNVAAMSFSVMVVNGGSVANQQTIDLGSASMPVNINNADLTGGVVSFDIVFAPSAGTFTINNSTPLISVDIWSY